MTSASMVVSESRLMGGERIGTGGAGAWLKGALLVVVMALLPVYTRESGGFQIVDVPIVLLGVIVLVTARPFWPARLKWVGVTMLAYTLWMVGVEVVWFMIEGRPSHLLGMVQKTYALVMFWQFVLAFDALLTVRSARRVVLFGVLAGLAAVIGSGAGGRVIGGFRQTLSFNNPDQLAYFAILSAACALLALTLRSHRDPDALEWILGGAILVAVHYLCFMSVSRSAIGGLVLLDAVLPFAVLRRGVERRRLLALFVVGAVFVIGASTWSRGMTQADRVAYLLRRFEGDEVASSFNQRLVVRFVEHREEGDASEMLFGTGKPNNAAAVDDVREVHSAFGEALLEGGVIGLALLLIFLGAVMALQLSGNSPRRETLLRAGVLGGVMFYNIFQVGTRFRMFWLFLAFACALVVHNESVSARRRGVAGAAPEA